MFNTFDMIANFMYNTLHKGGRKMELKQVLIEFAKLSRGLGALTLFIIAITHVHFEITIWKIILLIGLLILIPLIVGVYHIIGKYYQKKLRRVK